MRCSSPQEEAARLLIILIINTAALLVLFSRLQTCVCLNWQTATWPVRLVVPEPPSLLGCCFSSFLPHLGGRFPACSPHRHSVNQGIETKVWEREIPV